MSRIEDLTLYQGTDATFRLNIQDSNGDPKDLTDMVFSSSMKKTYASTESIDFQTSIIDANAGILSMSLTNEQTVLLDHSTRYVYDVMMYKTGNTDVTNIMSGKVFVLPTVTRVG